MQNLTKKFGNVAAVDHLDLDVEEGEILGLLGPNGAGKTTVILMLATVIKPTEGTATVGNYDIRKQPDKVRGLLGMVFKNQKCCGSQPHGTLSTGTQKSADYRLLTENRE